MAIKYEYQYVHDYIKKRGCKMITPSYKSTISKIKIQCICNNIFETTFNSFQRGKQRCDICKSKSHKYEEIKKYIETDSNSGCKLLSYKYKRNDHKLKLECKCGNYFERTFANFKNFKSYSCPECSLHLKTEKASHDFEYIKSHIEAKNNNKLISTVYLNSKQELDILCNCGNIFKTNFNNYSSHSRNKCLICSGIMSKGEFKINEFLVENGINFVNQYKIRKCKNIKPLPFDFAVFDNNTNLKLLIEFNGEQHYESVDFYGGDIRFKQQQINDRIKESYCKQNNIPFLVIGYWDFSKIENILKETLNKLL